MANAYFKNSALLLPEYVPPTAWSQQSPFGTINHGLFDAVNEITTWVGTIKWADEDASSKTLSKIHVRVGASTLVGTITWTIEGIAAGNPPVGNGTVNGDSTTTVDPGTGVLNPTWAGGTPPEITHGTDICIQAEITSYTSGSITFLGSDAQDDKGQFPTLGYSGAGITQAMPLIMLEADDGVFGVLDYCIYYTDSSNAETVPNTGTDEYGCLIKVPVPVVVDAFVFHGRATSSSSVSGVMRLYSDPLGTPAAVASVTIPEGSAYIQGAAASNNRIGIIPLASPVTLAKDTNYAVCIQNTSPVSGNIILNSLTVGAVAHWDAFCSYRPIGLTRDRTSDSSPAFTQNSLKAYSLGLVARGFNDGTGGTGTSAPRALPLVYR